MSRHIRLKVFRFNPLWLNELIIKLIAAGIVSNVEVIENRKPGRSILTPFYNRYGSFKQSILRFEDLVIHSVRLESYGQISDTLDLTSDESDTSFTINVPFETWNLNKTLQKDQIFLAIRKGKSVVSSKIIGVVNTDRVVASKIQLALHTADLVEKYFIKGIACKSEVLPKVKCYGWVQGMTSRFISLVQGKFQKRTWCISYIHRSTELANFGHEPKLLRADPFLFNYHGKEYCFYEEQVKSNPAYIKVFNNENLEARLALKEDYHLSYPQVFGYQSKIYMLPESSSNDSLDLYECISFPEKWQKIHTIFQGIKVHDATLLEYDSRLWLFAIVCNSDMMNPWVDLHIYYADSLFSDWKPHKNNPVLSDVRIARCGGRFIKRGDEIIRVCQNSAGKYGRNLSFRKLLKLTESEFEEEPINIVPPPGKPRSAIHSYSEIDEGRSYAFDYIPK